MPDTTLPEAITWSDTNLRKAADLVAQLHYFCTVVNDTWNAGMSSNFSNSASDYVIDGAYGSTGEDGDGRPVITTEDVWLMMTRVGEAIKTTAELNTVLAVAVNPGE